MSMPLTPQQIEQLADAAGKTMKRVCQDAGIAPSTFSRWKAGETEPTLGVYRRILAAATPEPALSLPPTRVEAA